MDDFDKISWALAIGGGGTVAEADLLAVFSGCDCQPEIPEAIAAWRRRGGPLVIEGVDAPDHGVLTDWTELDGGGHPPPDPESPLWRLAAMGLTFIFEKSPVFGGGCAHRVTYSPQDGACQTPVLSFSGEEGLKINDPYLRVEDVLRLASAEPGVLNDTQRLGAIVELARGMERRFLRLDAMPPLKIVSQAVRR